MIHLMKLSMIAVVAMASSACEKPGVAEQQREQRANAELQQARNEATQQEQSAQASADKDIGAARADFQKAREDYRHARASELSDLDKKIGALEAKEKTANGGDKAKLQADLAAIRIKREVFVRDMSLLDTATPPAWDEATAKVSRDWDALKSAVDKIQ